MKKLFSNLEYDEAKWDTLLSLECYVCKNTFYQKAYMIKRVEDRKYKQKQKEFWTTFEYCSKECRRQKQITREKVICLQCGACFEKFKNQILRHPNHFCSRSCSAKYNNTHKTKGSRRSKLETWLEAELLQKYPDVKFIFNDKATINSELDIFLPKYKLAFELNGIFHYEPIFGKEKLEQICNNDERKFQACLEKGIELCIIDVSGLKYFKIDKATKYYEIITRIIEQKFFDD